MATAGRHEPTSGVGGSGRRRGAARGGLLALGLGLALAGCQVAPTLPPPPSAPPPPRAGLPAVPPCASGLTATLSTGVSVDFLGADKADADVCLRRINGRTYRYLLGFWGGGRARPGSEVERQALRAVMTGPVGTRVDFALPRRDALWIWRSATVTHIGDPSLPIGAGDPKRTILLRVVRHGPPDRPHVAAETLWWIDWTTGIPLRQQDVIRMAHGTERRTAWQVRSLAASRN